MCRDNLLVFGLLKAACWSKLDAERSKHKRGSPFSWHSKKTHARPPSLGASKKQAHEEWGHREESRQQHLTTTPLQMTDDKPAAA
jgi:hypothetical protein